MNHLGTKKLETKRIILRQFEIEDAQGMFDNWASDEEVTKYLSWPAHENIDISKEYIKSIITEYEEVNTYHWGIEIKEIKQVIGGISVVRRNDNVESVHIGYSIGSKWWNKGITSEALSAVIDYLMKEVKVNRIECRHDTRNPYSGGVMKKCGLQYEGTLRESDINNQGIGDTAWYALLRRDYFEKEELK